jgi:hypothetical protein
MDKRTLKENINSVIQAFKEEGHSVELAGIIPLYPEIPSTSYILQIYSSWLNEMSSCGEALDTVIDKLYELLTPDVLKYINRVEICDENGDIHCMSDDLILNEINYQPLAIPYNYYVEY